MSYLEIARRVAGSNAEYTKRFISEWFKENGDGCNAVIGISGGKDSTVVAKLCCDALGKDRVIGVLMPNGDQNDIDVSYSVCRYLGIHPYTINIESAFAAILGGMINDGLEVSEQTERNLAPRLRMATLYAVAQSCNGRVMNTSNWSESAIGWCTMWGDNVGDVSPLGCFTATEVVEMGRYLGIPDEFVDKKPSDGITGATDEENFGFTYSDLDAYLTGFNSLNDKPEVRDKINSMMAKNQFKGDRLRLRHPGRYHCTLDEKKEKGN